MNSDVDAATEASAAPGRIKQRFHEREFQMWLRGMTHKQIAGELGIPITRVHDMARTEKWRRLLGQIAQRVKRAAARRGMETLKEVKARHSRVAALGVTRVERLLEKGGLDARALADAARATETFADLEERRHSEFVPGEQRHVFPELVSILEQVWDARRAAKSQAALCAPHNRALQPHDSQGEGDSSQRTLGPSPLALPRGVDPREAYCAEREAEDARRADSNDQGAHAASVTAPPLGNLGPGLPPCPPVPSSRRVGQ